jgi:23S rRNA (uracil1939-C5)-methyltransferase
MSDSSPHFPPDKTICSIDYVDNLGQGVDKKQDKITLVAKTLPNEKVSIVVTGEQSKIRWGKVNLILEASKERVLPSCIHYESCSGCHYLHTNYETEIELKKTQAKLMFKKLLTENNFTFHQAKDRLGYRNRIQLHYSKYKKSLGFMIGKNEILKVDQCLIIQPELKNKLRELYQSDQWLKLVEKEDQQGHIEIYLKENSKQVGVYVNRPYSEGGFSQVNQEMNIILTDQVTQLYLKYRQPGNILDLFGGNGNLTQNFASENLILTLDYYTKTPDSIGPKSFFSLDLFEKSALKKFEKHTSKGFSTFIVDPPRSGFKELKPWSDKFKPSTIIYVSCNPQTQLRDIEPLLKDYFVKEIHILDLFPATFHFESIVVLIRK